MLAVSCCQRSLAQTIHRPVSMRNRKSQPKSPVMRWDMPSGVQWRLCWSANSSGSGAGRGGASETQTTLSSSSSMRLLLRHARSVLLGHTRGCGAHRSEAVVGAEPLRSPQRRSLKQPVHTVKIVAEPEQEFADQFEVEPGSVTGGNGAVEQFAEPPPVCGRPGEV